MIKKPTRKFDPMGTCKSHFKGQDEPHQETLSCTDWKPISPASPVPSAAPEPPRDEAGQPYCAKHSPKGITCACDVPPPTPPPAPSEPSVAQAVAHLREWSKAVQGGSLHTTIQTVCNAASSREPLSVDEVAEHARLLMALSNEKSCGGWYCQKISCKCCHENAEEWQFIQHRADCDVAKAHEVIRNIFPTPSTKDNRNEN